MLKMSDYCKYAYTILDEGRRDILTEGRYWRDVEYTDYREFTNELLDQVLAHKEHPYIEQDCTTLDILDILGIRK